ncbi:MAG: hypothetical protein QNJ11_15330 [Woeseiaceae bacterium]|nr:hypothetical protein [Woeseiaceae bacterium]
MKNLIIWAIILGALGYGGSKLLLHHKVGRGVDQAILMVSPFVNIEYDGVSSTMGGQLTIDGVRAYMTGFDDEIYIDRLGIDTPSYFSLLGLADIRENIQSPDDVIPEYFGIVVEGVRMRVNADYFKKAYAASVADIDEADLQANAARCTGKYGFSPETLTRLGFSDQVVSITAHFRKGEGQYLVEMTSNVENMWDIDATMALAGDMLTELSKGTRYRPRMREMRIVFKDLSLRERVEKYCGQLGMSTDEIIAAQLEKLRYMGEVNGIEFDEYVIEPYTEFVKGKSTLVVTARPSEPVSLSQISLYKPSDVPALLDLSAEAL